MNSTLYIHSSSHVTSTAPKPCHPERSLAMSEANRQTESKDLAHSGSCTSDERNFRIAVRFFDEHETEQCPVSSREAAAFENPARKCRISGRN